MTLREAGLVYLLLQFYLHAAIVIAAAAIYFLDVMSKGWQR